MQIQEIRRLARGIGVNPGKQDKIALIRDIQLQEGNFDCFATANSGVCDQSACLWRSDCFELARKGADS